MGPAFFTSIAHASTVSLLLLLTICISSIQIPWVTSDSDPGCSTKPDSVETVRPVSA